MLITLVILGVCVFALFTINGLLIDDRTEELVLQQEEDEVKFMLSVGLDPWVIGDEA